MKNKLETAGKQALNGYTTETVSMASGNMPSAEHENWWAKELAAMTPPPSEDLANSPYHNSLPRMEVYREKVEAARSDTETDEK